MSLIEEVKLNLTRIFGDNNNLYAIDLLDTQIARTNGGNTTSKEYKYRPIRIDEHNLLMFINVCKSEDTGTFYRQVTFQDIGKNSNLGKYDDLRCGEFKIKSKTIKTELINNMVRISLHEVTYTLSSDYELFYNDSTIIGANIFDIIKGKRIKDGDYEQLDSINEKKHIVVKDMDKIAHDIEVASRYYPEFKKAADDCNLIETLKENAFVSIIILKQFVDFKSLKHILNHPQLSKKYYDYIRTFYSYSSLGSGQCIGMQKGNNAYEVLGVPEFIQPYVDSNMNDDWYRMIERIDFIKRYLRFDKKANAADVEWVDKMCSLDYRSERFMIGYSYLLDNGYKREDLNRYLAKIWDKQAIQPDDAIRYLYNILSWIEIMSNRRIKFFPKYLHVTFDVEQRRFKKFEKETEQQWVRDIVKNITGDFGSYSITDKNDDGSPLAYGKILRCQYLLYKNKNGSMIGNINILGNTVTEISSIVQSFTPKDKENIRKWAEEHHLFYAADKVLSNWREY